MRVACVIGYECLNLEEALQYGISCGYRWIEVCKRVETGLIAGLRKWTEAAIYLRDYTLSRIERAILPSMEPLGFAPSLVDVSDSLAPPNPYHTLSRLD